jgi:hypothetical protein
MELAQDWYVTSRAEYFVLAASDLVASLLTL